jgi:hypothetical protein
MLPVITRRVQVNCAVVYHALVGRPEPIQVPAILTIAAPVVNARGGAVRRGSTAGIFYLRNSHHYGIYIFF